MANNPTLGFLLHDVARLLRKRFEQRARGLGLTRSQWQTLANLNRCEGIHQSRLAEILEIEPITLVRILDRLEERGLIERRAHPTDRRVRLLYLREAARPLIAAMQRIGDATRGEALAGLPEADRDELMRMLAAMKANLSDAGGRPADDSEMKDAANG
jgi:MarR family transcriptional regulator, transcriptional regulator for hemolysin